MLDKNELYKMGKFDRSGRFDLDSFFETETSKKIRTPSRTWPLSVWKHCKTKKYFNSLSTEQLNFLGIEK